MLLIHCIIPLLEFFSAQKLFILFYNVTLEKRKKLLTKHLKQIILIYFKLFLELYICLILLSPVIGRRAASTSISRRAIVGPSRISSARISISAAVGGVKRRGGRGFHSFIGAGLVPVIFVTAVSVAHNYLQRKKLSM